MFGLTEIKNVFGAFTLGFVIEIIIAIVSIIIVYKKLKNNIIGSYKEREKQKNDIAEALEGVRALPEYRQQSLNIQQQLKSADDKILETCKNIQKGVDENQKILNRRLDILEEREKNALRSKILDLHRTFTNKKMNPMLAWSEMERDSFFKLVKDYESLHGNDYVHSVVIPDMNELVVILMSDKTALADLYHSRGV